MTDSSPPLRRRWLWLLLLVFTVAWFGALEYRKLIKPDEGRYAEIAREMAASGDWVTPRLNGIKYFEKPPLQYWATAAAFKAFGEDEWTARIWPGLTGFLGILLAWLAGRRLFGAHAGNLGALVLSSSLLYMMIGHINTLDMGLTFFLELSVFGFLLANRDGATARERRRWMLAAWAGAALAVLSKGLVSLALPGAALVAYSLATRDLAPWRRLEWKPGLPLFFAIAAPWFVAVSAANPEFARFFFIHEHFERFLTKAHGRYQPGWYFVPILLLGTLPWTLLSMQALAGAWRRVAGTDFQPARFLVLWCLIVFAFFSASGSKLPSYILPIIPGLALLTGRFLAEVRQRTMLWHLGIVACVAALALVLSTHVGNLGDAETTTAMMEAYERWITASAMFWLAGTVAAFLIVRRGRIGTAVLVLAGAAFLAEAAVLLGHERLGRSNSAHHIALTVRPLIPADAPLYSVAMYEQTLPFYLQRTVTLVEYRDELGFGLDQEPGKWVPTLEEFKRRWAAEPLAFAIMEPHRYDQLAAAGLAMAVVARDTRRVIVRNRASRTATE